MINKNFPKLIILVLNALLRQGYFDSALSQAGYVCNSNGFTQGQAIEFGSTLQLNRLMFGDEELAWKLAWFKTGSEYWYASMLAKNLSVNEQINEIESGVSQRLASQVGLWYIKTKTGPYLVFPVLPDGDNVLAITKDERDEEHKSVHDGKTINLINVALANLLARCLEPIFSDEVKERYIEIPESEREWVKRSGLTLFQVILSEVKFDSPTHGRGKVTRYIFRVTNGRFTVSHGGHTNAQVKERSAILKEKEQLKTKLVDKPKLKDKSKKRSLRSRGGIGDD